MSTVAFKRTRGRMANIRETYEEIKEPVSAKEPTFFSGFEELIVDVAETIEAAYKLGNCFGAGIRPDTPKSVIAGTHETGALIASFAETVKNIVQLGLDIAETYGKRPRGLLDLQIDNHQFAKYCEEFRKKWWLPDIAKLEKAREDFRLGLCEAL